MIATVEDGRLLSLRPDKDHPLSAGFACQKGIAFAEIVNDPDRVIHPARAAPPRAGFEPRQLGRGDGRHRPSPAPSSIAGTAPARSAGTSATRARSATPTPCSLNTFMVGFGPRMHLFTAGLAGRQQPLRRQPAAVRLAAGAADTRRAAHRPARRHRRQPDRLPRQRADRAADQGPHARHRQARRPGARHRSAQDRDRRAIRVAGHHSRRRRLPAALAAARAVRARTSPTAPARPPGRRRRVAGAVRRAVQPGGHRGAHRHRRRTPYGRWPATSPEPGAPRSTAASAPAPAKTARSQRICSTRSTWWRATSIVPGGTMFGSFGIPGERWRTKAAGRGAACQLRPQAIPDRRLPFGARCRSPRA